MVIVVQQELNKILKLEQSKYLLKILYGQKTIKRTAYQKIILLTIINNLKTQKD